MASGCSQGPCTLARNTSGAPVTQKRAWMQRFVSNRRSSFSPGAISTPLTVVDAGPAAAAGNPVPAAWAPLEPLVLLDVNGLLVAVATAPPAGCPLDATPLAAAPRSAVNDIPA